jgi:UDP-GlcNAc3NAcA epimerase
MSDIFFEEMSIPQPDHQLGIGSGSHGKQTGRMLDEIERVITLEKPDALVIYGDTNSTLAGALAAAKMHVPVIHIEAGLRSFNKRMPEEINRIMADHASTLLYTPTNAGLKSLKSEGFLPLDEAKRKGAADIDNPYVFHCGDLMYDNTLFYSKKADDFADLFEKYRIDPNNFILSTIHRPQNTDEIEILSGILTALNAISLEDKIEVVLPLHPRTANMIAKSNDTAIRELSKNPLFKIIEPVGFLEMILLEKHARMVMTDSGGVQKEAFFMQKPCVILRPETEWVEIVDCGCAVLTGSDAKKIMEGYQHFKQYPPKHYPNIFGDGAAAEFICKSILENLP